MNRTIQFTILLVLSLSAAITLAAEPSTDPPNLNAVLSKGIEVTGTDGSKVPLSKILAPGKVTVIEFWATWCPPCRKTIPSLVELNNRYRDQGLQVVGLTVEEPSKDLRKVTSFIKEFGVDYVNAFASPEAFRFVTGRREISVPKILIYNKKGQIIKFITSYSFLTHWQIQSAVKAEIMSSPH